MPKHGRTIILYILFVCIGEPGGGNFLPKIDVNVVFYRSNRKNYMTGVTNLLRFGSFFPLLELRFKDEKRTTKNKTPKNVSVCGAQ